MRRRFLKTVLVPLLILLALMLSVGLYGVEWAKKRVDNAAAQQQSRSLVVEIDMLRRSLAMQLGIVAKWLPLSDAVHEGTATYPWVENDIAPWLYRMFDHDDLYVTTPSGHLIYGSVRGRPPDPEHYEKIRPALQPNIDIFSDLRQSDDQLHKLDNNGSTAAALEARDLQMSMGEKQVRLAKIDGRPAIVTARPVGTRSASAASSEAVFVLLSVAYVSSSYLEQLATHASLDGLRFSEVSSMTGAESALQVVANDGTPMGFLIWKPSRPGSQMAQAIAPIGIGAFLLVVLISILMAKAIWRIARRLSQSIIELRASEAQAQHLAYHDVLTGLPNRALLNERIIQSLHHGATDCRVAVLMLDLDRFKYINDTLGHHAGDVLIKDVASRLSSLIDADDTVSRLGGDEFVIVKNRAGSRSDVEVFCRQIVSSFSEPFSLNGNRTYISASIGVVVAPEHGQDPAELMRKADIALYVAKSRGRDQFSYFELVMDEMVSVHQAIGNELRSALSDKEGLAVHYQPLIDASNQQVVGLEALLRWAHPTRGNIRPDEFIPVAEETGLIVPLGEWVLREACRTAMRWPNLFVAVNLSPVQFRTTHFARRMIEIVSSEGCPAERIEFEITEGMLLTEGAASNLALEQLREAGFRVALDDFGTGYSSLSYLRRFKVDKIKIDRSFIQNLGASEDTSAIIESVVTLGRAMGLTVVAEGVETTGQKESLIAAGCHELQGYLFSKAVPKEELAVFMSQAEAEIS